MPMTLPTKFCHVTQIILKIWPYDQSLVTLTFLWEKLSSPQFYKDLARKTNIFEGCSWFKFNNIGQAQDTTLKFYTKIVKNKNQKVLGANSNVCRSYRGKTCRGVFLSPHLE